MDEKRESDELLAELAGQREAMARFLGLLLDVVSNDDSTQADLEDGLDAFDRWVEQARSGPDVDIRELVDARIRYTMKLLASPTSRDRAQFLRTLRVEIISYNEERSRLLALLASRETLPAIRITVDPGSAPREEIAGLLSDLSILYRKMGGSGINFTPQDVHFLAPVQR